MEQIQSLIPPLLTQDAVPLLSDMLTMWAECYNAREGSLNGYACSQCRNKGMIAGVYDHEIRMQQCSCMKIRDTLHRIKNSGLEQQLRECTFRSFETNEPWQQKLKTAAMEFLESGDIGFFVGGQSGCGKTHLCTAIVGGMIKKGLSARYFVWREDSLILKSMANAPEYAQHMDAYKQADCLYIDDLFKQENISDADKKLAFELIDYRYRSRLITVISTERSEEELIAADEALAGRILQMSRGHSVFIPKDKRKNYRLK